MFIQTVWLSNQLNGIIDYINCLRGPGLTEVKSY